MQFELEIEKKMSEGFTLRASLATRDGALVLFGPSGSGKTLTLKALAGLLTPDRGRIVVDGEVLFDSASGTNLPTRSRGVGYVFQDYALFPTMTVRANVAFGLRRLRGPFLSSLTAEDAEYVDGLLEVFGLWKLAGMRPGDLSGGQRQRTALARALATRPRVLLLDEPFSALDQPLRERMRGEVRRVLTDFGLPIVLVTHDAEEAAAFADSVAVYEAGAVTALYNTETFRESGEDLAAVIRKEVERAYVI